MERKSLDIATLSPERLELIELLLMEEMEAGSQITHVRQGRENVFPLSFAQQRLWFLDRLKPGNYIYNESVVVRLLGKIHIAVLERSLNEIIRRHESLRTTFTMVEGRPMQVIGLPWTINLERSNLLELTGTEQEAKIRALAIEETQIPFDLGKGPLLRVSLVQVGTDDALALLTIHHIISDGWSMGILVQELATLYDAFLHNMSSPLPDLPIQYRDFAIWQQSWLQSEALEQQMAYWKTQLRDPLPTIQLPFDRPRPATQTFHGATYFFRFPALLTADLKRLGQKEDVTLFMVLHAAFTVLLHYYSGQDELIVGTDVASRNRIEIEGLIGFFVNQLVLRTNLAGNPGFREVLRRVREVIIGAFAHQDLPFNRLVEALNPRRDLSHTPLFQVKFVLQNAPMPRLELEGLHLSLMEFDRGIAKFDLLLNMWDNEDGLAGALDYNTDLFDTATISLMIEHFEVILQQFANPSTSDITIEALEEMLSMRDKQQRAARYQGRRSANRQMLGRLKRSKPKSMTV